MPKDRKLYAKGNEPECLVKMMSAIKANNAEVLLKIINDGCPVNMAMDGTWPESPLTLAIQNESIELIKILIDNGADINHRHGRYSYPISNLSAKPLSIFKLFEDQISEPLDSLNTPRRFDNNRPFIDYVISVKNYELLEYLLKKGMSPNGFQGEYRSRYSPLGQAIQYSDTTAVRVLIESGANVNERFDWISEDCQHCPYGITPLHEAVSVDNFRAGFYSNERYFDSRKVIINRLIKSGADCNAKSHNREEDTPMSYAVLSGNTKMIDFLLKSGCGQIIESDIWIAASHVKHSLLKYLLQKGLDPNFNQKDKSTPLILTIQGWGDSMGSWRTIEDQVASGRVLLSYGADPTIKNSYDMSYLDLVREGFKNPTYTINLELATKLKELLWEFGYDINSEQQ